MNIDERILIGLALCCIAIVVLCLLKLRRARVSANIHVGSHVVLPELWDTGMTWMPCKLCEKGTRGIIRDIYTQKYIDASVEMCDVQTDSGSLIKAIPIEEL